MNRFLHLWTALLCCASLLLPAAVSAEVTPAALSGQLTRLEQIFWRTVFSGSNISSKLAPFLNGCRELQFRSKGKAKLSEPAMELKTVVSGISQYHIRGFNINFKTTSLADFQKASRYSSAGGGKKGGKYVEPGAYQDFLQKTANENMELFRRRYDKGSTLTRTQKNVLQERLQKYFDAVGKLRMELLKLQQGEKRPEDRGAVSGSKSKDKKKSSSKNKK